MRKVLVIFLAVLLIGSMAYGAPDPTGEKGTSQGTGAVGEIKGSGNYASDCYRTFRLVRNSETGADVMHISPDSMVIWDTVSDDGVTVTLTTTSGDSRVAGVAVSNILTSDSGAGNTAVQDLGRRNWGYIQTYGLCQVSVDSVSTTTAGYALGTGSIDPGKASGYWDATGTLSSSASNQGDAGFYLDDAAASANNVEVFLSGLE